MKALLLICVFVLPLQTLQALPLRHRVSIHGKSWKRPETGGSVAMETVTIPLKAWSVGAREHRGVWRALLHKEHLSRQSSTVSSHNSSPLGRSRGRRHDHRSLWGHPQGQLMRVGCVLGTCQVQNLSHRLYQLMGQNGRHDSPINPNSPQSYG